MNIEGLSYNFSKLITMKKKSYPQNAGCSYELILLDHKSPQEIKNYTSFFPLICV